MELTKYQKEKKRLIDKIEEEVLVEWCKPIPRKIIGHLFRFTSWHKAIERVRRFEGLLQ